MSQWNKLDAKKPLQADHYWFKWGDDLEDVFCGQVLEDGLVEGGDLPPDTWLNFLEDSADYVWSEPANHPSRAI